MLARRPRDRTTAPERKKGLSRELVSGTRAGGGMDGFCVLVPSTNRCQLRTGHCWGPNERRGRRGAPTLSLLEPGFRPHSPPPSRALSPPQYLAHTANGSPEHFCHQQHHPPGQESASPSTSWQKGQKERVNTKDACPVPALGTREEAALATGSQPDAGAAGVAGASAPRWGHSRLGSRPHLSPPGQERSVTVDTVRQ